MVPAGSKRAVRQVSLQRLALVLLFLWAATATFLAWSEVDVVSATADWWVGEASEVPGWVVARQQQEEDGLKLVAKGFEDLPGWQEDDLTAALEPFRRSCAVFLRWPPERAVAPTEVGGVAGDWHGVCQEAMNLEADNAALRHFWESRFVPLSVRSGVSPVGLFTGYYEPLLRGSRHRHAPYVVPLYRRPSELIDLDLGAFRPSLKGQRLAGVLRGRRLEPFADRAAISEGALRGRGLELVWVDNPVDAFFLHIQGSGRIQLEEGGSMRVGYAGQNGHIYTAIGRELVSRGEMLPGEVTMQSLRRWLELNPEKSASILASNASFVFFRELEGRGPVGSLGVVLTAERSLAVDRSLLPLGAPFFLEAMAPQAGASAERRLRRLLVAQDTGGAIRGAVRGDIFWGAGDEALDVAGRMKHKGRYWILLPKDLASRVLGSS